VQFATHAKLKVDDYYHNGRAPEAETPRILQDVDREPAVISFVAAGLGVVLLPEPIKRFPHEGVIFRPLRRRSTAESETWNREVNTFGRWDKILLPRTPTCILALLCQTSLKKTKSLLEYGAIS
jgi:hypothetical protein